MSVGSVLTIMFHTTEEKVFIVKHHFRSNGVGRQNGPSLHHVREHYEEQVNKTAPSNKTILATVEKFHRTGSVFCQRKGTTLWWSLNFLWDKFPFPSHSPHLTAPDDYIWGMLKESIFRSDDPPGNVPELWEKRQSLFVSLQQPVSISMSNNLKDRYEQCVKHEGTHFEHMLYRHI